ncbi:hypothetical protein [Candidatus Sororendozoicomonas aggregata]|uniref:hypothetical protein n=1 Tax=Candidatus Sororendozoicomonas aggregata TaxID=3073239 RepID=UPI002ED6269D
MLHTFAKFLCCLGCGLTLSTTGLANSATVPGKHHSLSAPREIIAHKYKPWEKVGSTEFRSSSASVSFSLDKPRSFAEIKFTMDKAIRIETARFYSNSGEVYTLAFQQPKPQVETSVRLLPKSLGVIQKVTVYYKDTGKHQGTITLRGRNLVNQGA